WVKILREKKNSASFTSTPLTSNTTSVAIKDVSSSKNVKAGYNYISSRLVSSQSWVPLVFRKSLLGSQKRDRREETREVSSTRTNEDNEAEERVSKRKTFHLCRRGKEFCGGGSGSKYCGKKKNSVSFTSTPLTSNTTSVAIKDVSSSKNVKAGYNYISSWLVSSQSWVPLVFRKSRLGSQKRDRREETREVSSTRTNEDNEAEERVSKRKTFHLCRRGKEFCGGGSLFVSKECDTPKQHHRFFSFQKILYDGELFQYLPVLGTSGVQEESFRVTKRDRREETREVSSTRTNEDNEAEERVSKRKTFHLCRRGKEFCGGGSGSKYCGKKKNSVSFTSTPLTSNTTSVAIKDVSSSKNVKAGYNYISSRLVSSQSWVPLVFRKSLLGSQKRDRREETREVSSTRTNEDNEAEERVSKRKHSIYVVEEKSSVVVEVSSCGSKYCGKKKNSVSFTSTPLTSNTTSVAIKDVSSSKNVKAGYNYISSRLVSSQSWKVHSGVQEKGRLGSQRLRDRREETREVSRRGRTNNEAESIQEKHSIYVVEEKSSGEGSLFVSKECDTPKQHHRFFPVQKILWVQVLRDKKSVSVTSTSLTSNTTSEAIKDVSSSKNFKAIYNYISSWLVPSQSWVPLVFRKSLLGSQKRDRREETREVSSTRTTEGNEAEEKGSNRKTFHFC
ncbi:hypothetical protein TNIN_122671, partial [Trichonephila inaurata madagascariensis]